MSVLVPIANGFEEIELISIVDTLRRADIEVKIAGINGSGIYTGAHKIEVNAPFGIEPIHAHELDAIILAGGYEGMINLKSSKKVLGLLKDLDSSNKLVAAICASPIVLNEAAVIKGRAFTCYPGCEDGLNGKYVNKKVVSTENLITAAGPSCAIDFGVEIVRYLKGEQSANNLENDLLLTRDFQ